MADVRTCPTCGAEIPTDAPGGLCPRCLLRQGLASEGGSFSQEGSATEAHRQPGAGAFVPPLPSELRERLPQFEFLELLGQGGMGAVYKARQASLDRLVAVKILPPDAGHDSAFAERFAREARAMARLSHPHIVNVYDFGQAEGQCYLVMEYVEGVTLRQAIRAGAMSPKASLEVVGQICEALQYAHDEGVVHRDIKPENILLDRRGRVKIADFGLAKLLGGSGAAVELTGTHQVLGTLRYMAPEQIEGSRAVDHRADIYSLGVVFYELLTGEVPMGRFQPPSAKVEVDVRIDEVVLKSLEREPERRYQHASEVKSDVDDVTGSYRSTQSAAHQDKESDLDRLIRRMVLDNKGLAAIRAYRAATGAGLSEAYAAVRKVAAAEGVPLQRISPQQRTEEFTGAWLAMIITGVISWITIPLAFWIHGVRDFDRTVFQISFGWIPLIVGTTMVLAGFQMKRLEGYRLALFAAVLPIAVLVLKMVARSSGLLAIGPADLIGAPMGVWLLVALTHSDVKARFQRHRAAMAQVLSNSEAAPRPPLVEALSGKQPAPSLPPSQRGDEAIPHMMSATTPPPSEAEPAPSDRSALVNFGLLVVFYFAGVVGLGVLWQFHNPHLMLVGFLVLAALALHLVQWQSSQGNEAPDRPSGDSLALFAVAIIAAALLKWSGTAVVEAAKAASLEGEAGSFWANIWLPVLVFLGAFVVPPVWRRLVLKRSGRQRAPTAFDWRRLPLLAIGLLIMAAGIAGIFNLFLVVVDSMFWHPHHVAASEFEDKYLGSEAQLLNQLPESDRDSGQAQLVFDRDVNFLASEFVVGGVRSGHWGMSEWAYLVFGTLILIGVIAMGVDASQNESSDNFLTVAPAATTIGLPFAAALGLFAVYTAAIQAPLREPFREPGIYQTIRREGKAADFANKIGARLSHRGFTPDSNWGYRLQAPDGEAAVAEFRYALFEPTTLFDRWAFTTAGIVRRQPLIVVTQLSGLRSGRNVITIDARAEFGRVNERKWAALVNELKGELHEVRADDAGSQLDTAQPPDAAEAKALGEPAAEASDMEKAAEGGSTAVEEAEAKVFYQLGDDLKAALKESDFEAAESSAEAYLALAPKFTDDWNYGNAIHDGNAALGLVALVRGRMDQARDRLRDAGKATSTPQLASFGPDLKLAAAMVALGERRAVVEYLGDCRSFWTTGGEKIDRMVKAIEGNTLPWEFSALGESPLVGAWLAERSAPPDDMPGELIRFRPDGRMEPTVYGKRSSTFRREGDKVIVADPDAPDQRDKDHVFELRGDRLIMPEHDPKLPFTPPKEGFRRSGETASGGSLSGKWVGALRFAGLGEAKVTWTFEGEDSGACTMEVRAPSGVSFRYAAIGNRLVYKFADSTIAALAKLSGAKSAVILQSSEWKIDGEVLTIDDYWQPDPAGDKRRTFRRFDEKTKVTMNE